MPVTAPELQSGRDTSFPITPQNSDLITSDPNMTPKRCKNSGAVFYTNLYCVYAINFFRKSDDV